MEPEQNKRRVSGGGGGGCEGAQWGPFRAYKTLTPGARVPINRVIGHGTPEQNEELWKYGRDRGICFTILDLIFPFFHSTISSCAQNKVKCGPLVSGVETTISMKYTSIQASTAVSQYVRSQHVLRGHPARVETRITNRSFTVTLLAGNSLLALQYSTNGEICCCYDARHYYYSIDNRKDCRK